MQAQLANAKSVRIEAQHNSHCTLHRSWHLRFAPEKRLLVPHTSTHRYGKQASTVTKRCQGKLLASTSSSRDSLAQSVAEQSQVTTGGGGGGGGGYDLITAALGLGLWAAFAGYAFFLSPNQTPYRDMYFLEKLSGLGVNDGVQINAVFTQLFFVMGLWPCIYAALLIPSARSGNKLPAWPFVTLSFGVGMFALGPFFALWTPSKEARAPASPDELQGWRNFGLKGAESKLGGWLILAGALFLVSQIALAGGEAWTEYLQLFNESRFVHVTSLDFAALCLSAPFWMWNDAEKRQWPGRQLLPLLACVPFLGPAIYLALRPKTQN